MFFRAICVQVNIKPLELLLWIRTRWGSLVLLWLELLVFSDC
jgi:hypothetical protein